jgi:hypothetical protein
MRRDETRQTNDRCAGVLARPSCVVWWESAQEMGTDGCSATRWLVDLHANDARVEPCLSSIDLHSLTLTAITALETRKL